MGYDATEIYNPTGGMGGDVSLHSSDNQPAEYIDATKVRKKRARQGSTKHA